MLHRERLERGKKRLHPLPKPVKQLPDGAMVLAGGEFSDRAGRSTAVVDGRLSRGGRCIDDALLLTPPSTLRAQNAGYRPLLHPSAGD